jgi:hypothetical protein
VGNELVASLASRICEGKLVTLGNFEARGSLGESKSAQKRKQKIKNDATEGKKISGEPTEFQNWRHKGNKLGDFRSRYCCAVEPSNIKNGSRPV